MMIKKLGKGKFRLNGTFTSSNLADILCENAAEYFILEDSDAMTSPKVTKHYLKGVLSHIEHESFCVMFLTNRHRIIKFKHMFRGTIDGASVHPREVVKEALKCNCAAVIFAHNHPSGIAEPSTADISLTSRLKEALALVDVRVLDHFIVGDGESVSLSERGLI